MKTNQIIDAHKLTYAQKCEMTQRKSVEHNNVKL